MDDRIGPCLGYNRLNSPFVFDTGMDDAEIRVLLQHPLAPLLQRHVVIIGHRVKADNRPTVLQKPLAQVKPNKAG